MEGQCRVQGGKTGPPPFPVSLVCRKQMGSPLLFLQYVNFTVPQHKLFKAEATAVIYVLYTCSLHSHSFNRFSWNACYPLSLEILWALCVEYNIMTQTLPCLLLVQSNIKHSAQNRNLYTLTGPCYFKIPFKYMYHPF